MNFPVKVNIKISEEADKAINALAKAEQRSSANMHRVLLDEAIKSRKEMFNGLEAVKKLVDEKL